jgi:hypothetical protein
MQARDVPAAQLPLEVFLRLRECLEKLRPGLLLVMLPAPPPAGGGPQQGVRPHPDHFAEANALVVYPSQTAAMDTGGPEESSARPPQRRKPAGNHENNVLALDEAGWQALIREPENATKRPDAGWSWKLQIWASNTKGWADASAESTAPLLRVRDSASRYGEVRWIDRARQDEPEMVYKVYWPWATAGFQLNPVSGTIRQLRVIPVPPPVPAPREQQWWLQGEKSWGSWTGAASFSGSW